MIDVPTRCAVRLLAGFLGAAAVTACTAATPPPPTPPSAKPAGTASPGGAAPDRNAVSTSCPTTAAARLGWGAPTRASDFDAGLPADWHPYGRWEACVRSDPGPDALHPVLILWPVAEDFPVGGEIDWMEIFDGDRQEVNVVVHHGPDDDAFGGKIDYDATRWTAWAVEWTPRRITTYRDGERWYSTDRADAFPPRPMNMTAQLDWFPPEGGGPASSGSALHLDWTRQWALPESRPAALSLAPGDAATGQPRTYPDRKPRPLAVGP